MARACVQVQKELTGLKTKLREKENQLMEKKSEIEELKDEVSRGNRNIQKYRNRWKEINEEAKDLQQEISLAQDDLKQKESEVELLRTMMKKEKKHRKELEEMIQRKEREIAELREEVSSYQTQLEEKTREADQLRKDLLQTSKDLREKSTLVTRLGDEKAVIAADNFFLRASVEMLTQRAIGGIQTLEVSGDKPFNGLVRSIFKCSQNQTSADCKSSTREMEGYQQMVREKEEKITELSNQIHAQEAVINQLMEQATSQATAVSRADELDKAVMEVVNLRRRVNEAEDEKQKAFARVFVAEGMLKMVCR